MKISVMYPLMAAVVAASITACTGSSSTSTSMSGTSPTNGGFAGDYVMADPLHESYCTANVSLSSSVTGTCKCIYDDALVALYYQSVQSALHTFSGSVDSNGSFTISGVGGLVGSGTFDTSGNATLDITLPVDTYPLLYHQTGFSITMQQNSPITDMNYLGPFFSPVSTDNYKSFALNIMPNGTVLGGGFTQGGDTLNFDGYFNQRVNSFLGLVNSSEGRNPDIMSGSFFSNAVSLTLTRFSSGATTSAGDQFLQGLAYPNPYQGIAPASGLYQGTAVGPSGSSPFLGMFDYQLNWAGFNKLSFYGGLRGDILYGLTSGSTPPYPVTGQTYTISMANPFTNSVANGSGFLSVYQSGLGFIFDLESVSVSSPSSTVTITAINLNTPMITIITVNPPISTVVGVGATQQYTVTALYTDGTTTDVTSQCTFTALDPSVATAGPGGLATSTGPGFTQIIANYGVYTGHTYLAVSSEGERVLVDIRVMPPWPAIATNGTQSFIATAHFSDGSSQDVTTLAVWSSDTTTVATVDSSGVATGVSAGTAKITATYSGMSDTRPLQVTDQSQIIGLSLPSFRAGRPYLGLARIRQAASACGSPCLPPGRRQVPPRPHPA